MSSWSTFHLPGKYRMDAAKAKHERYDANARSMPLRVSCAHCGRGKNARDVYAGHEWYVAHKDRCRGSK